MSANTSGTSEVKMPRYQFIVGVSLPHLEAELNRIVCNDPGLTLNQILHAQGTGFVAVIERAESAEVVQAEQKEQPDEVRKNQRRSQKTS